MKVSARRALLMVCAAAVFAGSAQAQTYPVKPVRFMTQAAEPAGGRPGEYAAYIAAEIVKWSKVVKESGATLD